MNLMIKGFFFESVFHFPTFCHNKIATYIHVGTPFTISVTKLDYFNVILTKEARAF